MTNPAYQLAAALRYSAVPPHERPESTRGFADITDLDAWREVQPVTELVTEVDRTLAGMNANGENVSMFLETLPKWYAGAHFATVPWSSTSQSPRPMCPSIELNLLDALGALIEAGGSWEFTEEVRRSLTDVLDEAKTLIETDTDMPMDVRRYLWSLLTHAHLVVEQQEKFGPGPLRHIALELGRGYARPRGNRGAKRQGRTGSPVESPGRPSGRRLRRWGRRRHGRRHHGGRAPGD